MKRDFFYVIIILLLILALFKFGVFDQDSPQSDVYRKHIISIESAKELRAEYLTNRKELFQPELRRIYEDSTFEDTEFVWFPLESIRSYLNFIDNIQANHPGEDISGLRLYFMAYPKSSIKYKGQQSIFMVPTVRYQHDNNSYETMNNLPFYLNGAEPENPFGGKIALYTDLMSSYLLKDRLNNFNKRRASEAQKASLGFGFSTTLDSANILNNTSTIFNESQAYPPPKS
ncbi:hypothetical protein [Winogradskyella sp.]|uniref:hypothetical protein n=1 Tax=Winogradskyella sp. TaxID=1883156 RepID=UPI003BA85D13